MKIAMQCKRHASIVVLVKSCLGGEIGSMEAVTQERGVDEWKLEQIRSLRDSGLEIREISDQVDLDIEIVKEILRLID